MPASSIGSASSLERDLDEREYAPRLAAGNRSSGDPRGYAPLIAGRGSMPRPRKGGRERSDRWKGETRSGFLLQVDPGNGRSVLASLKSRGGAAFGTRNGASASFPVVRPAPADGTS